MNTENRLDWTSRRHDLVVWGATGFVGRLVAEYLHARFGVGGKLRWAIGGRSREKLEALRRELGADADSLPIVTGDAQNMDDMGALAASTRVVCATVGPYSRFGTTLVDACAYHGTDYCDLCGEVPWMRRMIDSFESTARKNGARIVHCCGFDAIPSDLGVYFLQKTAQERGREPCPEVHFRLKAAKGSFSGGTVASLLTVLEEARDNPHTARLLADPYALNPIGERHGQDGRDRRGIAFDADLDAWIAPFVMAGINTRVVRRSNALMNYAYGEDFRYDEAVVAGNRLKALATAAGQSALLAAAGPRPLRNLLERFVLPKSGEGPSREERERGFFDVRLIGKYSDGATVRVKVTGDRDPGYGATCKMLAESALCLLQDDAAVATTGGFWTPASALGEPLVRRLQEYAGLCFQLDDARPRDTATHA